MNVVRALLSGLMVTALVIACGSDNKDNASSSSPSETSSPLSKCITGGAASSACQSCVQSKCASQVKTCYGANFSGGACQNLVSCAADASDPCSSCVADTPCESCIQDTLLPCVQKSCSSSCTDLPAGPAVPTCADLEPCCERITNDSAKTGCEGIVKDGSDSVCGSYYNSIRFFCTGQTS